MTGPRDHTSLWALAWIGVAVLFMWVTAALVIFWKLDSWTIRGQFGDMFGGLNALFSGLAFAGVIFTIHLQRQELSLQRRELELTRRELQRTAAAQEASQQALNKQAAALKVGARLNALSSLIQHYEIKIAAIDGAGATAAAQQKRVQYIGQLEQLLDTLSTAENAAQ